MTTTTPPPSQADARLPRGRRYTVRALLVVATVLAVVSIFAVWANRQILDANNWADTSTALLENKDVRTQVSGYVVDQVYSNVDVAGQVSSALPRRLRPLAAPAASGLRELAQSRMDRLLQRPRVQEAWKNASRATAQQFIAIAKGDSRAVGVQGNAVYLDLRVIMGDLVTSLGLPHALVNKIPPNAGRVRIMSSDQVSAVQDGANALSGLAVAVPLLTLVLFALAVFLARGRRRRTLLFVGIDLVLAGIVVLIARNVIGQSVVDSLAKTDAVKPATAAVWSIGTGMLRDIAQALILFGIPVIFAAWLAGPTRPAVAVRRAAAPWLRDRPGLAYGLAGALLLLVIAWGPIPATRMVVPVLIIAFLLGLGVYELRRQTAVEFPFATADATRASMRDTAIRAQQAVLGGRRAQAAPVGANGDGDAAVEQRKLDQLERLASLHDTGVLTDEEFAAEKASVLAAGIA